MTFFSFLIKDPGLISSLKENTSQLLLDMFESPTPWHLHAEAIVTALRYQDCDNWSLSSQMTNRWTLYTAWILWARSSFLPQENMGGHNVIMLLRTVHNLKLTFTSIIYYLMVSDHAWCRRGPCSISILNTVYSICSLSVPPLENIKSGKAGLGSF